MSDNDRTDSDDDPALGQDTHWQHAAQRLYEPDRDGGLTTAIVFAIAEAKDVAPTEVRSPPLYEVVDVAGLEKAFFGSGTDVRTQTGAGTVEFRYTEYLVRVRSDGWIIVSEPTEPEQV